MPYFAVLNEGTEFEQATIGLGTPEQMEEYVDKNIESGTYTPLQDNLLTVTIFDMTISPITGRRKAVKAYMWGFQKPYEPHKVNQVVEERVWMFGEGYDDEESV